MFRNSGCVELFPTRKDRVAKDWNGVGSGPWSHIKLCYEMKRLCVPCTCAELPACFQLCFSEGEGEEGCRNGVFPSELRLPFNLLLCLAVVMLHNQRSCGK